jgi:hypothetical protein
MTALAMRWQLRQLQHRHRLQPQPCIIALTAPTDRPMILNGYASTTDIDLDRCRFRGWAFTWLPWAKPPPLLFKHKEPAGTVDALDYDQRGNLKIRATVTHPVARRCGAFSVGAKVIDYEIREADGPNFHAVITRAEVTEVSLTDVPSNPNALVLNRHPDLFSHLMQRVGRLSALLKEAS